MWLWMMLTHNKLNIYKYKKGYRERKFRKKGWQHKQINIFQGSISKFQGFSRLSRLHFHFEDFSRVSRFSRSSGNPDNTTPHSNERLNSGSGQETHKVGLIFERIIQINLLRFYYHSTLHKPFFTFFLMFEMSCIFTVKRFLKVTKR